MSWNWQNLTLNHLHLSLLRRFYLLARRRWKPRFAKNPPKKTPKSWLLPRKVRHRRKQIKDIQHSNHANRDVSSNIFKHYHSLFSILRSFKIFTQYICAGLYFDSLVIFTIIIKNGVQSTGLFTYYVSQKPSLISEKMDCCWIYSMTRINTRVPVGANTANGPTWNLNNRQYTEKLQMKITN